MTGVIRLVSPQPTVPPVLLPPADLPHSWGPLSQDLAVVLKVQVTSYKCVCVLCDVCVVLCVCVCMCVYSYITINAHAVRVFIIMEICELA